MMTDELIPARFWKTFAPGEFKKFALEQNGILNTEQCARLWRMEDRQGEPPHQLEVLINVDDFNRLYPSKKSKGEKQP